MNISNNPKEEYFSGQGKVYLNNRYIGNCPTVIFYNDNSYAIEVDNFHIDNIKHLLGNESEYVNYSIEQNNTKTDYLGVSLDSNISKEFYLEFHGINTTSLDKKIIVKTKITLGFPQLLSLITNGLSSLRFYGNWQNPLEYFVEKDKEDLDTCKIEIIPNFIRFYADTFDILYPITLVGKIYKTETGQTCVGTSIYDVRYEKVLKELRNSQK